MNDQIPMGANHYELLGVHPSATAEAIRRAWRIAAGENHPDLHSHSGGDADGWRTARMAAINEAYQTLSSPVRRRLYDLDQGLLAALCAVCGEPGRLRNGGGGNPVAACDSCWQPPAAHLAM